MSLNSETLTYWYFRLNGFFTIPNFVVHPNWGNNQRTEIDVFGIRLPNRSELPENPMKDDEEFTRHVGKAFIAFVEVACGQIGFNQTWRNSKYRNVERFLSAAGAFPADRVNAIAESIYETGCYTADANFHVSFVGIGNRPNATLKRDYPCVPQITWKHIGEFIFDRFKQYPDQKGAHPQWDNAGQALWKLWEDPSRSRLNFCAELEKIGGRPRDHEKVGH